MKFSHNPKLEMLSAKEQLAEVDDEIKIIQDKFCEILKEMSGAQSKEMLDFNTQLLARTQHELKKKQELYSLILEPFISVKAEVPKSKNGNE
jgi:hypothetical protein